MTPRSFLRRVGPLVFIGISVHASTVVCVPKLDLRRRGTAAFMKASLPPCSSETTVDVASDRPKSNRIM